MFEYRPEAQAVHLLPPVREPVLVIEPKAHTTQSLAAAEPVVPTYVPAVQSVHAATLDAIEYFPTAHAVHTVAPLLVPLSVIEPAPHGVHDPMADSVE